MHSVVCQLCLFSCVLLFRTAQSLIWFLTMLWTSGWLAPQQTSVFLSRSCTTPVKPTGRGKQVVWESQGSWERQASRDELINVIKNWQELVTQIPMNPKTYRHDGRALFFPNTQNSLTASPNLHKVMSHGYWGYDESYFLTDFLLKFCFVVMCYVCSIRCLHHESGHLSLQSLLESCKKLDGFKPKSLTRSR